MSRSEKQESSTSNRGRERPSILERHVRRPSILNRTRKHYDTGSEQRLAKSAKKV